MMSEELVDVIAEAIFRHTNEIPYNQFTSKKDYSQLTSKDKEFFLGLAHSIITIVDDYYDGELDEEDDEEDEDEEIFDWPLDD